ncbi:hypothetical protein [Solimonas fluminis]|uniref:hypothetical protein n=1 Tax=Solimonas fluminis TaxID=2086571 RepID=UPI0010575721|nr:hypothetical protein [Solimonas fluminis]
MRLGILLAAHLFFLDAVGMAMCIVLTQQPRQTTDVRNGRRSVGGIHPENCRRSPALVRLSFS